MKIVKFEEIISWQKAQDLAVEIYSTYEKNKDYDFNRQIFRAVVSISNNIAEGFDRTYPKEFQCFLFIALASNSEVKSMLYLSKRLNFISEEKMKDLIEKSEEISRLIYGLIKSIDNKINIEN